MSQRTIEIFTSGCFLCEETVRLVKELSCPSCTVTVYDVSEPCESQECVDKVKRYGITSVPTVVVDGDIVECCRRATVDREALMAAGIGQA